MRYSPLFFLAFLFFSCFNSFAAETEVNYTVITSSAVKEPTQYLQESIKGVLGKARPRELDYGSSEAKAWIKKLDITFLPYVIFNKDIQDSDKFFELARAGMITRKSGEYVIPEEMILPVGVIFFKRKPKPGQLDLFMMSQCPGGKEAVKFLDKYLTDNPKAFRLKRHYIVNVDDFGIESLHGKDEVREDVYQILIQKYYPDKFLQYHTSFRNGRPFEISCKPAGIDPDKIKAKMREGIEFLRRDAKLAQDYGVKTSPTFIWEGRVFFLSLLSFQRFLSAMGTVPRN